MGAVRFLECDGTQTVDQLAFGTQTGAAVLDLTGGPAQQIAAGSALAWQVTRNNGTLAIAPETMAITSVVNSAGFGPGLSPGELFTIFGAGFTAGAATPSVTIGGQSAQIFGAFPFQINALIPAGIAPGNALLQISGPLGAISQNVTIQSAAPGIFAIVNQDGTLNGASNPAQRGAYVLIYGRAGRNKRAGFITSHQRAGERRRGRRAREAVLRRISPGFHRTVSDQRTDSGRNYSRSRHPAVSVSEASQTSNTVSLDRDSRSTGLNSPRSWADRVPSWNCSRHHFEHYGQRRSADMESGHCDVDLINTHHPGRQPAPVHDDGGLLPERFPKNTDTALSYG